MYNLDDTIVALATPIGKSAIAVIRLSGEQSISIVNTIFKGKDLLQQAPNTVHFGVIYDGNTIIDEVLVTIFKAPRSFTKEDSVEISCHGTPLIIHYIIQLTIQHGVRTAKPGEFTQRALLNGQFDLAQAEAVADLIAANSVMAHKTAMHQLRGGLSEKIKQLRKKMVHCTAMLTLSLDFSEEDVDFADKEVLQQLSIDILHAIQQLLDSFVVGNIIKEGLSAVIVGKPNVGKSTLLNALLNEERAIVSDIPGTTRDFIEASINIEGIQVRFIDTAGLRETTDPIEALGVVKTREKMQQAALILYVFDLEKDSIAYMEDIMHQLKGTTTPFIMVGNKVDAASVEVLQKFDQFKKYSVLISATTQYNLDVLKQKIVDCVQLDSIDNMDVVITNVRHYESLLKSKQAINEMIQALKNDLTLELLLLDMRTALYHLGEVTGEVTTEEVLGTIFSKFCIGK